MVKWFFVFMCFCFGKMTAAQVAATGVASATIMHTVGAEELRVEGVDSTTFFAVIPAQAEHSKKEAQTIKELDFTTFRIVGNVFVYALTLEPGTKSKMHPPVKKSLSGFTVKPSTVKPEAFVLSSQVDVERARRCEYVEQTTLDVIIHFN